ncbi:hypothetical protein ACO0SA_003615 [Hanseniaspora valbyensis]
MDQLIHELNKVNSKFQISAPSNGTNVNNSKLNDNPLPLSLKLLDTSSIGLNNELDSYLKNNEHLNTILKDYVGDNYKYILNDNMSTYLKIYKEYSNTKSIDYKSISENEINNNTTKSLQTLNNKFAQNSKMIHLISLIEYIYKEQDSIMSLLFNASNSNIALTQYNHIIKKYKKLDNIISLNKLYLFHDISIVSNNNKIKEKIKDNLFTYLMDLIFKNENNITTTGKNNNNTKSVKYDLKFIIDLFDQLNSNAMQNMSSNNEETNTSYEFIMENLEKLVSDKFEDILINEVNHLREDAPYKYELIKKHKFKNIRDLLAFDEETNHDLLLASQPSKINTKNENVNHDTLIKSAEVDIIVYEFFSDFFNSLNSKIVYLLLLVDLMDGKVDFLNNIINMHSGNDRIIKLIDNFLLKILKLYLIPSLSNIAAIPKQRLNQDDNKQNLFVLNKDILLSSDLNKDDFNEEEKENYLKLQQIFDEILPGMRSQAKDKQEKKEENNKIAMTKNEMLLIIPSNLMNLKYILPNLTSIMKTLTRFSHSANESFLPKFLNDFYINELFNNNIAYILNTKIYNINLTHGTNFFKINGIIETFIFLINKILNLFPGLEYQFNSVLMTKIYEIFKKFINHIVDSFKNFIKMFINLNTLTKDNLSDFKEIMKLTSYIKGSNEYGTINEKFILSFIETYKSLNRLNTWFKDSILANITLVNDLQPNNNGSNDVIDFEDLKEMWLLNVHFYEDEHIDNGEYAASIDGILLSTTLNNLFHELIYSKLDNEFTGGLFQTKVELFTLFELNKVMMTFILNDDSSKKKTVAATASDKFEYLYLREDNHVDVNIVTIKNILANLFDNIHENVDIDFNKFMNFIILNNFMNSNSYSRIGYLLHNLEQLQGTVNITESMKFLSLYELNVNDIINYNNENKDLYALPLIKHLIKLKLEFESGTNKSILQKRLDDAYKHLK